MEKRTRIKKIARIMKTLDMLFWLGLFGAGAMTSPAFVWGLYNALQRSNGTAAFILTALGILAFAGTLYAAFMAFHVFTANQKNE